MEILKMLGEQAGYVVAIAGVGTLLGVNRKSLRKGYRWCRSWTFIKRDRLQELEQNNQVYQQFLKEKPLSTAVYTAHALEDFN